MRTSDAIPPSAAGPPASGPSPSAATTTVCDVCGSTRVRELRCKVICTNCGTILQSCADL